VATQSDLNAQAIRDMYDAFANADAQGAFAAFTEDSVWYDLGDNIRAGVYRGTQAVLEHAIDIATLTEGSMTTTLNSILPGDDGHFAVLEHASGRRGDATVEMDCCTVFKFDDAAVAEMRVLPYDSAIWDAFWSR
jgi:ketosteroid isomerase-like protein